MKKNIEVVLKALNSGIDEKKLEAHIKEAKNKIKKLLVMRMTGNIADEIYKEENLRFVGELNEVREQREKIISDDERKTTFISRIEEIEKVLNQRDGLLNEFDGELFGFFIGIVP